MTTDAVLRRIYQFGDSPSEEWVEQCIRAALADAWDTGWFRGYNTAHIVQRSDEQVGAEQTTNPYAPPIGSEDIGMGKP